MTNAKPRRRLRLFVELLRNDRAGPRPSLATRWWHWLVAAVGSAAALRGWLER